jgi:5-methylcytosine-specific restriction endonuclease McrA
MSPWDEAWREVQARKSQAAARRYEDLKEARNCPLLKEHRKGFCDWCSAPLSGRQRRWCAQHRYVWAENHIWDFARKAAMKRDEYLCCRCGKRPVQTRHSAGNHVLEVNHINPRRGGGYHTGCHHHLDNLETLCIGCHRLVSQKQKAGFAGSATTLPIDEQLALNPEAQTT